MTRTRVSEHPPWLLPNGPLKRRPLPSAGSFGPVPPLRRYYETLRPPAAHLAALRCLRLAIPPLRRSLLPAASTRDRGLRGVGVPVPEPELLVETDGSPRFLGNPCVPMPCSWTPVGPRTPGHCGASTWPPLVSTTKAPAMNKVSGLDRTALGLAVYASSWRLPDTTQNSLPAAWPSLAGREFVTRRVAMKGF